LFSCIEMKQLCCALLLATLFSCQAISTLQHQKIVLKSGEVSFSSFQNRIEIPVEVARYKTKFIVDTGAMFSVICNPSFLDQRLLDRAVRFGKIVGASGKTQAQKLLSVPAKSALFESENKVFAVVPIIQSRCTPNENKVQGIVGMDLFYQQDRPLLLAFSTQKISLLDLPVDTNQLHQNGYVLVTSKFKRAAIFVYGKLEEKPFWFQLDSGFSGTAAVQQSAKNKFKNPAKKQYVGTAFQTATQHTYALETFHNGLAFSWGDRAQKIACVESGSLKKARLGFGFMQGYDWIFDFRNKQIYAKRNSNKIPESFKNSQAYRVLAGDKLRIVLKDKSAKKFHLGDEILAVNGQKVTAENCCQLEQVLNNTPNWDQLELLVSSNK